jgi:hypothetical protein
MLWPVKAGADTVPAGVIVWPWTARAEPVKVCVVGPVTFAVPPVVVESAAVVWLLIVPAGVPAVMVDVAWLVDPVNVGALFVPTGVAVDAPPVSRSVSKATLPASKATGNLPVPNAAHVPKPSRVDGLAATADMKIEPMGQHTEMSAGVPGFPCGP